MAKNHYLAGVGKALIMSGNELIGVAQTLTNSTLNFSITGDDIRGGRGNALIGKYFHDSNLTCTLTDALFNLQYIALSLGVPVDQGGITIKEELKTELDSNKISKMTSSKTIILPDKYLSDDKYLEAVKFAIKKSYEYLDDTDVKVTSGDNYILVTINASNKETLILNNIEFYENNGLQIKINPNTKSSDVVTLSIKDKYTEGELMTHMKNNGYTCK